MRSFIFGIKRQAILRRCMSLYEKSVHLNAYFIDTALMSDATLTKLNVERVPALFDAFAENRIAREETGEIVSAQPELLDADLGQVRFG